MLFQLNEQASDREKGEMKFKLKKKKEILNEKKKI